MSQENTQSTLLSLAVHEFRTPTSVVSGYLRMLERSDPPLGEQQLRMVKEAGKSCARIVELIAELSEVAKLDAGEVKFERQPFDLFSLIDEVAAGMHESRDRGVRLTTRGAGTGAPVLGDAARLRDALGAIVRAILREQPSSCAVVADRRLVGAGDDREALVVIAAEPGVQSAYESAAEPFDDRRGGLGLILPIGCRIILAHGGRVWQPKGASRGAALVSLPVSGLNVEETARSNR
jgi:two-component system, sensor histidine kinase and response regulator